MTPSLIVPSREQPGFNSSTRLNRLKSDEMTQRITHASLLGAFLFLDQVHDDDLPIVSVSQTEFSFEIEAQHPMFEPRWQQRCGGFLATRFTLVERGGLRESSGGADERDLIELG
ncbi:MAG: hypothetical protein OEU26_31690 [Candidatus Tectomicrobia bacterium]|nr:hypothetical protein [Candidatus Tectomicrobia bacterium]